MKRLKEHLLLEANTDEATRAEQLIVFAYNCLTQIPSLKSAEDWQQFHNNLKGKEIEDVGGLGDAFDKLKKKDNYSKSKKKVSFSAIKTMRESLKGTKSLVHTGSLSVVVNPEWTTKYGGGGDATPKTDIASSDKSSFKMSLKVGEGRYMATKREETKAIFRVAFEKAGIEKEVQNEIEEYLDTMMVNLGGGGGNIKGMFDTAEFKKQFTEVYIEGRVKELETALRDYDILSISGELIDQTKRSNAFEAHAKAEASIIGIRAARAKNEDLIGQATDSRGQEWIDPMTKSPYDPEKVKEIVIGNFEGLAKKYLSMGLVKSVIQSKVEGGKFKYLDSREVKGKISAEDIGNAPHNKRITYAHVSGKDEKKSSGTITLGGQQSSMKHLLQSIINATKWEQMIQKIIENNEKEKGTLRVEILREAMRGLVKFKDDVGTANYYVRISGDYVEFEEMNDSFFKKKLGSINKVSVDLKGGDDKWQIFTLRAAGGAPEPEEYSESFSRIRKYILSDSIQNRYHDEILNFVERKHSKILEQELRELDERYFGGGCLINEGLWSRVVANVEKAKDAVGRAAQSAANAAKNAAKSIVDSGVRMFQYVSQRIQIIWNRMVKMVGEYFTKAFSWLKSFLSANFFNLLKESGIEMEGNFEIDL
jgi:hypothetical protein